MSSDLVAIDWGTSRVRAALIGPDGQVRDQRESDDGILKLPPGGFEAVFERLCGAWMRAPHPSAPTTPPLCLMSGMVGSRNGWHEAAYAPCPAGPGDLPARLSWIAPGHAIVPGLMCEHEGMPDVMRGEEVQAFGALALLGWSDADATLVLPGTHSKWVEVRGGRIQRFRTCMSGEFYALLREHSILGRGVPTQPEGDDAPRWHRDAFEQGLQQSQRSGSLLASAFSARSRVLMQQLDPAGVPDYLSGLVIGEELRMAAAWTAPDPQDTPVVVIGAPALTERYAIALQSQDLTIPWVMRGAVRRVGAEATWHGLMQIARHAHGAAG